ncbi:SID1 transmembrane family member 1-like [Lingula anatina]|uniref:SID1 transmembrane family member 1-like n=2 Tax=Lingula anatina TaxID=7574 RepID=A0A2R2MIB4_LINAN|nr:SID1 transmembrane family member 1-like [Lingula anatina]|eukprot:XP_023929961.1 SID1 transmembrane family member 1-like [Lingula anatina]
MACVYSVWVLCAVLLVWYVSAQNTQNAQLDTNYVGTVFKGKSHTYAFNVFLNETNAVRIHVEANATASSKTPVLFVEKQQSSILSWQLPLILEHTYNYYTVSRTLCNENQGKVIPDNATVTKEDIEVSVSSFSEQAIYYKLNASRVADFFFITGKVYQLEVSPSTPIYFQYVFPENVDKVLVRASSEDDLCMVLSIQELHCPVFDLDRNVEFTGEYQTMTKKAAISVQKSVFGKAVYIVLVVKPRDYECLGTEKVAPPGKEGRWKSVTVTVEHSLTVTDYYVAIGTAVAFFGFFYLVAVIISFVHYYLYPNKKDEQEGLTAERVNPECLPLYDDPNIPITEGAPDKTYGTQGDVIAQPAANFTAPQSASRERAPASGTGSSAAAHYDSDSSLDEADIDMLADAELEKDVFRTKPFLYVADLSRKGRKVLRQKFKLYQWNLITIAIFYGLPVIQLVITYQTVLHVTGNQDLCYYNFLCSHPLGVLSSFNNVFSNIGYIMLGLLFLGLTWRRDYLHKKAVERNDIYEREYGIPQHFGLFYAMGLALAMEGFMSGCYHVCPSYTNFQFDTSFMYVIAVLCMLKIYQSRHPDISATAYSSYFCLAFVIFIAVIGVVYGSLLFWIVLTVVHMLACMVFTVEIYYMGRWKMAANLGVFKRIWNVVIIDRLKCVRPMYVDRAVLLVIGNLCNWALAFYGVIERPKDFASYLLAIFIINLLLYTAFYIAMKIRHKEKIMLIPCCFILLAGITWGFALWFFMARLTSWELTPAQSREGNQPCMLLQFYDQHDVWHFLSATALFLSFMILLTLDDDLVRTPRDKIPVF